MGLSKGLIIHPTSHLGQPVVYSCEQPELRSSNHHIVKVRHDKIRTPERDVKC